MAVSFSGITRPVPASVFDLPTRRHFAGLARSMEGTAFHGSGACIPDHRPNPD
jgi:hypothetical protein